MPLKRLVVGWLTSLLQFFYSYDANGENTIDISGQVIASTKKYGDAVHHGHVPFVVDNVLPLWQPRFIEIRETVQALSEGGKAINRVRAIITSGN